MKISKYFLFFLIILVLSSCDVEIDNDSVSEEKPLNSTMEMSFSETTLSSDNNEYEYIINVDEKNINSGYFLFTASHNYSSSYSGVDPGFEFKCADIQLINSSSNSCMLDFTSLTQLGAYVIEAKSKVSAKYDRYFTINIVSNLTGFVVEYKIQDSYVKEGLEYTDEMKSGIINASTGELELCAGAVYDFTVKDKSENNYTIKGMAITSSSPYVSFKDVFGPKGEMVLNQIDGETSLVTFKVGKTTLEFNVKIKLKDISKSSIEELKTVGEVSDFVLSFKANTPDDPDKHYDYQIVINQTSDEVSELMFCTDFYNWSMEMENAYLENKYTVIPVNPKPSWQSKTELTYIQEDELRYTVVTDGVLKQISITPIVDTVFTSSTYGEKNLHTYLYARYKSDPEDTYRFRWRIMVGGELEGLDMIVHSESGGDLRLENNILEIHPNDEASWIFRASYVPATTNKNRTLWYLSGTDEVGSYTLDSGRTVFLPIPAGENSEINKSLKFFDGRAEKKTFGEEGTGLTVCYYYLDENTTNGISEVFTNYGINGLDCKLVAVNLETGIYNTIKIKNYVNAEVIIKGSAYTSSTAYIPYLLEKEVFVLDGFDENNNNKPIFKKDDTGYSNPTWTQEYPYTAKEYGVRTFYVPYESRLVLTFDTTFDIDNLSASGDMEADRSIVGYNVHISDNKREAFLTFNTFAYEKKQSANEVDNNAKLRSLTAGAYFQVKLNDYLFNIKIITFDPNPA